YENVAFGIRRHEPELNENQIRQKVNRALELVHLPDIHQQGVSELSYGMQKRVSLARTIAIEPRILLFDEPTTGLDPVTTNVINQLIFELSRQLKTTSIVVSHDMHCALDIADRVLVLDKGQILEQGTPEELKKSSVPLVKDFLSEALNDFDS
ncbi:MAG: ATP-binding cassette domain-containing protein, partial [Bdellovibrionales bacterium]|nr:ATP-binding cassette domain-containing protein [Bdellovibrionales bacterium]